LAQIRERVEAEGMMTPPIDILEIASRRLHDAHERLRWCAYAQHSEWATVMRNDALFAVNLAEGDMLKARGFGRWLDDHQ